jgi:uncharacterized protein YbjQ (UPF0145 family)
MDVLTPYIGSEPLCPDCELQLIQRDRDERKRQKEVTERAQNVLVTTTPTIEGHRIVEYLGIESIEIVIGTGFLSELTGEIADFMGRRSMRFEAKLQEAKRLAFDKLKFRAADHGANAVVGIDLDYTEFSGNRIGLILNGTLVRAVPMAKRPD